MAKFLYVTDLHGNRAKYERALALARATGVRLIINGGDMLPHGRLHDEQSRFIRDFLDRHFAACQGAGIRYLTITANDDLKAHDGLLDEICERYPLVEDIAGRAVTVDGYDFIGFNLVTDYPFRLKDRARMDSRDFVFPPQLGSGILSVPGGWEDIPDWPAHARTLPTIEEELAALPGPADPSRAVYVIHGPPARLGLDVVRGGSTVGSVATLKFLEKTQPLLSLHGHIHESPEESGTWRNVVGRTVCIQPGQSATGLTVVLGNLGTLMFERRVIPAGR